MESSQHTFEEFTIVRSDIEERLGHKMNESEWTAFVNDLYDRLDFEGTLEDLLDEINERMDYDYNDDDDDYEFGGEGGGE